MKPVDWASKPGENLRKKAEILALQKDLFGEEPLKKKVNKSKPVQRSLKELTDNGWTVAVVEKWIPPRGEMKFGIRRDVWGFGDLLACRPDIYSAEPCPKCKGTKVEDNYIQGKIVCDKCYGHGSVLLHKRAIALVQCCRAADMAEHKAKILGIKEYYTWRKAGGRVFLQGWAKQGARGQVKRWKMREEELTEEF